MALAHAFSFPSARTRSLSRLRLRARRLRRTSVIIGLGLARPFNPLVLAVPARLGRACRQRRAPADLPADGLAGTGVLAPPGALRRALRDALPTERTAEPDDEPTDVPVSVFTRPDGAST